MAVSDFSDQLQGVFPTGVIPVHTRVPGIPIGRTRSTGIGMARTKPGHDGRGSEFPPDWITLHPCAPFVCRTQLLAPLIQGAGQRGGHGERG
ncbi:hypothetical protein CHELA20_10094 [Hyphomicrobiales bacterium]|nr:hypothetical protein CHELA20_10094 [Hyphomicrobiales bacterium]CAH1690494.1 hypothetical protein CHELA41_50321 [Hyphomicrobiales bacterium]